MGTLFSKFFSLVEFTPRIFVGEMVMEKEEEEKVIHANEAIDMEARASSSACESWQSSC